MERRNTIQEDRLNLENTEVAADTPETLLIRKADTELLQAAIARLSPPFREVVLLTDLEEMKYQEVAETLGIPIGTVMSRLARARRQIRQHVIERLGVKT
jgi:RNA polymerase sigma-70 factor (ECF subfamily)